MILDKFRLDGKVALVTGAGPDLRRDCAPRLGYNVAWLCTEID